MQAVQTSENPNSPQLLVICPESAAENIQETIALLTRADWRDLGDIELYVVPKHRIKDSQFITSRISHCASKTAGVLHVLALKPAAFDSQSLHGNVGMRNIADSLKAMTSYFLPKYLAQMGLDTISLTEKQLSGVWEHAELSRHHIQEWVEQFNKAGNNKWIGENLLKVLVFWSSPRLMHGLNLSRESLSQYDCIAISGEKLGASASTMATRIKKQLDSQESPKPRLMGFREALEASECDKILYVEDCSLTGNEMMRVFLGLLGKPDPFGPPKATRLQDGLILKEKKIQLRFALSTNWGTTLLEGFLRDEKLHNINLDRSNGSTLQVLSEAGVEALRQHRLVDNESCVVDPAGNVIRQAFVDLSIWRSEQRQRRAIKFCENIGYQLYRNYQIHRGKELPSEAWLMQAGLGVQGLAMAFAFSHSVPKSTLPLFWMGGTVSFQGRSFEWIPLFQNAI